MQNVTSCLWFDNNALEACTFYASVVPGFELGTVSRSDFEYPEGAGERDGGQTVITVEFGIGGQRYVGLNGGPQFPFTEAFSIQLECDDQAESDRIWDALTADGGQESACGWLKDKYGLSWQVYPAELTTLMSDPDPERARRATQAMLTMGRIDVAAVRAAADGS